MKQDARFLAVTILNRFENKHEHLSLIRNQVFSQFKPEPLSKSRATVLTNETVRLKGRLELMVEFISGKSLMRLDRSLRSILQVGFYEILYAYISRYLSLRFAESVSHRSFGLGHLILPSLNTTCFRTTGSYFRNSSFSV